MRGWKLQRQYGNYWLFGVWADRSDREWAPHYPRARVTQITAGLGRWKWQIVKVEG